MDTLKQMTARRPALYIVLILTALSAVGLAPSPAAAAPSSDGSHSIDAAKLYHKYCAPCHGDRGDGNSRATAALNPPPRDFTTAKAADELSRERMLTSAMYGRPGTAMVGWKRRLSKAQITAIVDYIRSHFMKLPKTPAAPSKVGGTSGGDTGANMSAAPSGGVSTHAAASPAPTGSAAAGAGSGARALSTVTAAVAMDKPFPDGLKGNFAAGRKFYMHNCFTCHGRKGNGRGPRSKFMHPKPRDFLSADTRAHFNRPTLFHAISKGVVGSVMPAWEKVLTPQQIANVAEFVFEAFVQGKGVGEMDAATAAVEKKKASSGY